MRISIATPHRKINLAVNIKRGGVAAHIAVAVRECKPCRAAVAERDGRHAAVAAAEPQSGSRLMLADGFIRRMVGPHPRASQGDAANISVMSYTKNYQHIVFATKYRRTTIPEASKRIMLKFIHELCIRQGWYLVRINACRNHVHMLVDVPPTVLIPDMVKLIKVRTSQTFQRHAAFPDFEGWGKSYGAFSVSHFDRQTVIDYIAGQEAHHLAHTFDSELESLLIENGIVPDGYAGRL